eukprot:TRINITY_DN22719_c4_g1_i2.p2 TRINITY_DN22719_c4_g1~~TRINITY_DN22719_c4_g1_i2.p2  ORF type:complete len:165 (-),score=32.45 TRINITY_DN22719_c4_g1_i2:27-521(-)
MEEWRDEYVKWCDGERRRTVKPFFKHVEDHAAAQIAAANEAAVADVAAATSLVEMRGGTESPADSFHSSDGSDATDDVGVPPSAPDPYISRLEEVLAGEEVISDVESIIDHVLLIAKSGKGVAQADRTRRVYLARRIIKAFGYGEDLVDLVEAYLNKDEDTVTE